MTREQFAALAGEKFIYLDGATGSNLQKAGMPAGVCPEAWILDHPDVFISLQKQYLQSGTDILYAPTFSANRIKLAEYGLRERLEEMNIALVGLSKRAVGEYVVENGEARELPLIAGDVTMTGKLLKPVGTMDFEEAVEVYREQFLCLEKAGVDLFVIETMMSLQETRAALLAAREVSELPVMVTMSFDETGHTLYGTTPETAMLVLQGLGADAVGVNCGMGPDKCVDFIRRMKEVATVPVIAKPNAGLPHLENGVTVYDCPPDEFARQMVKLAEAGAQILGGCCGTTPEYIRALKAATAKEMVPVIRKTVVRALTNERRTLPIRLDGEFLAVGERINPTGKKAFQESLRNNDISMALQFAREQEENGAAVLDINVGMSGINEKEMLCRIIEEVSQAVDLPLSVDTSDPKAMEAALRIYPGRALVNSVSLEEGRPELLFPIVKKYGAMVILLPLGSGGLPKSDEERRENLRKLIAKAAEYGIPKEMLIADGLVMTVGAQTNAALSALDTIKYCKDELKIATTCGLSNISYGLPERGYVNAAFLTMAIAGGLTMAIVNPNQELLMSLVMATDLLRAKEGAAQRYIERAAVLAESRQSAAASVPKGKNDAVPKAKPEQPKEAEGTEKSPVFLAVLRGERDKIAGLTEKALKEKAPDKILKEDLIPAITEAGDRFEQKRYFLPQLIGAAETMKIAVELLEPLLAQNSSAESSATVVLATVAGDIHDIGKNLVGLMLKNHGFRVIDLGKDVPTERILDEAEKNNADIIALSALMTTTMREMAEVVKGRNARGIKAKIMIGGAVTTPEYAAEIGAEGYGADAQETVHVAKRLLQMK